MMRVAVGVSILVGLAGCGALGLPSPGVDAGADFDTDAGADSGATAKTDSGVGEGHDAGDGHHDAGGSPSGDAGTPFGADSGLFDASAPGDSGVVDSGAPGDSGAVTVDSGTPAAGPFQPAALSLVTTRGNVVHGVSGVGNEVYLVTDFELFRSSGGPFKAVPLTSMAGPGIYPSMQDVYVAPNGAVFALAQTEIFVCPGNCADGGVAFTTTTPLATTKQGRAMCGDSAARVFAVFDDLNNFSRGWMVEFDGSGWSTVSQNLGIDEPRACAITAAGEVAIAGKSGIALYDLSDGSLTTVSPGGTQQAWVSIGALGNELWAGGLNRRTARRTANGTWVFGEPMTAQSATYSAIGVISPNEVYAGAGSDGRKTLGRFTGSAWVDGPVLSTVESVRGLYLATPNVMYVAGSAGSKPAIDRLTR